MRALALVILLGLCGCEGLEPILADKPSGPNGIDTAVVVPQPAGGLLNPGRWHVKFLIHCGASNQCEPKGWRAVISADELRGQVRQHRWFKRERYVADDDGVLTVYERVNEHKMRGLWEPRGGQPYVVAPDEVHFQSGWDNFYRAAALQIRTFCGFSEAEVRVYFEQLYFNEDGKLPPGPPSCF